GGDEPAGEVEAGGGVTLSGRGVGVARIAHLPVARALTPALSRGAGRGRRSDTAPLSRGAGRGGGAAARLGRGVGVCALTPALSRRAGRGRRSDTAPLARGAGR